MRQRGEKVNGMLMNMYVYVLTRAKIEILMFNKISYSNNNYYAGGEKQFN